MQSPKSAKPKFTKEELLHSLDLTLAHPNDSSNPSRRSTHQSTARQATCQRHNATDSSSPSDSAPEVSRRTTNKSRYKDYDVGSLFKRTVPMNSYSPVEVVGTIGSNRRSMDPSTSQNRNHSSSVLSPSKRTTRTRPSLLESTGRGGASHGPETRQRPSLGADSLVGQFSHPSPYFSPPTTSQDTQHQPLLVSPTLRKRMRPSSIFVAQSDDDEVEVQASSSANDQELVSLSPQDNPARHRIMRLRKRDDCLAKPQPSTSQDSLLATKSGYVSGPDASPGDNPFAITTENQGEKSSLGLDAVYIGNFTTGPTATSSPSQPAWKLQLVAEEKPPPLWPGHRSRPQWSSIMLVSHIPKVPSVTIPLSQLHIAEYYLEAEPYMVAFQTTSPLAVSFYRQYYIPHSMQMTKGLITCMLSQTPCCSIEAWLKQLHDCRNNSMTYRVVSMSEGRWSSVRELLSCLPPPSTSFTSRRSLFNDNVGDQAILSEFSHTLAPPTVSAKKGPLDGDSPAKNSAATLQRSNSVTVTQDSESGTSLRRSSRLSLRVDHRPLFVFPFSGVKSVTITTTDVPRLDAGEYLNDSIIEFYLKFLQVNLQRDSPELADQIHIFNTFFYPQLTAKSARKLHPTCYDRVKSWTTKVNIFNKRFIFIPIHEKAHWYLALVCNPGCLTRAKDTAESSPVTQSTASETDSSPQVPSESATDITLSEAVPLTEPVPSATLIPAETKVSVTNSPTGSPVTVRVTDKTHETGSVDAPLTVDISSPSPQTSKGVKLRNVNVVPNKTGWARNRSTNLRSRLRASLDPQSSPFIVLFDSLGLSHPQTFHILNEYLAREAETKNLSVKDKASGIYAKIPCQTNHCDCGIYLLQYVETFLRDPAHYLDVIIRHTADTNVWFPQSQIAAKRESIKSLISQLTIEYQDYKKPVGESPSAT
ncbi:hypothetical protein IWQ61_002166 [Dispira simplex]|nr:hypothetical protein IWQ61_002166 [Dispira simplex]